MVKQFKKIGKLAFDFKLVSYLFFFCLFRAKNMKKKFQFLRRRNTDTAIGGECHSSSVFRRPTPDQVQKWSRSFDSLLNDKGMCPYRSIPEYQLDGHFEKSEKKVIILTNI